MFISVFIYLFVCREHIFKLYIYIYITKDLFEPNLICKSVTVISFGFFF